MLSPEQEALVKKLEGVVKTPEFQKRVRDRLIKESKELENNERAYRPTRAMLLEPFDI